MKRFVEFCSQYMIFNPFPLSEKLLCYYAVFMAKRGLAHQTIKTYMSATRNMHISLGFPDPRDSSSLPILRRIHAGIQRVQSTKGSPSNRVRLPITPAILDRLRAHWEATQHKERLVLWAVSALCFAGFFRLGELLPSSKAQADQQGRLLWGDIAVDNARAPRMLRVHLRVSKCDQFGKGVNVFMGKTGNQRCPVTAAVAYMVRRGQTAGPFFLLQEKNPLLKQTFVAELRSALTAIGMDPLLYAGHSFRIGAATAASQAGLPDSTIQTLGRWSSAAFLLYIQTPGHHLASLTARIL